LTPKDLKEKITLEYKSLKDDLLNFSSFHTTRRISLFFDSLIIEAFSNIKTQNDFCLIAGGSYSNLELCPYSDVDIMVITREGLYREDVAKRLKDFFYLFWDASVDLAQSVRTVKEAIGLMKTDFNTYTSFINARYITGNKELYDGFKNEFKKIDARSIFLVELMKSLRRRRLINVMVDNDIFLLEPDVKEGIGGLRDYSFCEWVYYIAKKPFAPLNFLHNNPNIINYENEILFNGSGNLDNDRSNNAHGEGNGKSIISETFKLMQLDSSLNAEDIINLYNGKEFILKVRVMMHLIARKKLDRLTFDIQEKLSHAFYYKDGKFLNKIEYFMHDYYINAKNIHIISRLIINFLIKPTILIQKSRQFYNLNVEKGVNLGNNLYFENGLICIRDRKIFLTDVKNIFRLLDAYQLTGERLDIESINLLKIACSTHRKLIKNDDYAKSFFINLLKKKKRVYQTLLLMHETKILSALIPEFEKIDSLSTNDVYHVYTVDAHSLNGIRYLEDMVNLRINKDLKETFEHLKGDDLLILNFSLLLHDIGKGYSSHHEQVGSKIAVKAAKRLGFDEESQNFVNFLILNHFLLPLTSERRDIHDPATIKSISYTVKDIRHLQFLFIVSLCDSMAVSKTRFNSWRKMLLVELYDRTLMFLKNAEEYFRGDLYYIDRIYEYVLKFVGKKGYNFLKGIGMVNLKGFIDGYIDKFYSANRYLMRESPENILLHLKLFSKITDKHRFNFVAKAHVEEDYYEIVICGEDKKTIFSDITGVLSYFDFNIMSADINTRKDGRFIDTFFVNHIYKKVDGKIDWHKLRNTFFNVFNGRVLLDDMFKKKRQNEGLFKKSAPHVSNSVEIYNNLSDEFTVIEIQALDRKGLLYDIGRIFNRFDINIFVSKITTQGNKAFDTFYVKDSGGDKIKSLLNIRKIKRAITMEL
jgi:[protein-PII] uridylyltransferase